MINSRHDCFKVFVGPYIKAIEDQVYENDHFVKHIPVNQRYQRVLELKRNYKYYYATDYTAYESHFVPKAMFNLECAVYRRALKGQVHLGYIQRVLTGINRCRTRTGIKCPIRGRRMSGDMTTSLGNGLSNMLTIMYLMYSKGCAASDYDFLVEGDDGLIACNVPLKDDDFVQLGFTIKIERVDDPCLASFCGIICTETGENIREPCRFFEKFGWTNSSLMAGERVLMSLLKAKCMSALCETPNCPVVAHAAWYCYQKCGSLKPRFTNSYMLGFSEATLLSASFKPPDPSPELRELFHQAFKIDPPSQVRLEMSISRGDFTTLVELPFHPDVLDYSLRFVGTC